MMEVEKEKNPQRTQEVCEWWQSKKSRIILGFLSTSLNHQSLLWFCLNCRVPSLGTASHRPRDLLEQLGFISVYKADNQGMEDGAHPSLIFTSNQNMARVSIQRPKSCCTPETDHICSTINSRPMCQDVVKQISKRKEHGFHCIHAFFFYGFYISLH